MNRAKRDRLAARAAAFQKRKQKGEDQSNEATPSDDILEDPPKLRNFDTELLPRRGRKPGNGMYFGKLSLNTVTRVEPPKCLPEDKRRKQYDDGLQGYGDDDDTSYLDSHLGGKRRGQVREEPFEVVIPLGNDRMKTPEIKKALKAEYAARYLEMLGASPTPQNLQLIWKYMPLEKCKIQQVFHPGLSKSEKKNYISIRPMYKTSKSNADRFTGSDVEDLNPLPIERLRDKLGIKKEEQKPQEEKQDTAQDEAAQQTKTGRQAPAFSTYKERYVFPYNLPPKYTYEPNSKQQQPKSNTPRREAVQYMRDRRVSLLQKRGRVNVTEYVPERSESSATTATEDTETESSVSQQEPTPRNQQERGTVSPPSGKKKHKHKQQARVPPEDPEREEKAQQMHQILIDKLMSSMKTQQDVAQIQPEQHTAAGAADTVGETTHRSNTNSEHSTPRAESPQSASLEIPVGGSREKEIDQPPTLTQYDILDILGNFIDNFPFKKYWSGSAGIGGIPKLSEKVAELKAEIRSEVFAEFVSGLAEFFYWSFLAPLSNNQHQRYDKDQHFLCLYEEMLTMLERKKGRQYHSLSLPLAVLALRVGVDTVFQYSYPTWIKTQEGQDLSKKIDSLLTILLDPMDYLSHLPPVESSPQALKILHKKRIPTRMPLTFTSPMVRFVVGNAQSKEAKSLLSQKNTHSTQHTQQATSQLLMLLSPALRSKILNLVAVKKLGQPAPPGGLGIARVGSAQRMSVSSTPGFKGPSAAIAASGARYSVGSAAAAGMEGLVDTSPPSEPAPVSLMGDDELEASPE
eukprot:TRINITY_DN66555_c7_g2_i1.p1 TRINITY_DN66555_c7_g2~~TRINITY_DN66555_c7_g2_i1.p1  ORF type:complete len:799 (+),score=92.48 TRINITY_DN66555_c7_g2_i1:8-2404(+)